MMDFTNLTHVQMLVERCLNGDRTAHQNLYQAFYGKMMGVCMRYASERDTARDFLQDGFVRVFQNLHKYDGKGSFEGWIRRIIVNQTIDTLRKQRTFAIEAAQLNQIQSQPAADDDDWETEQIQKAKADVLITLVQQLSPVYRTVFNLYVVEEYTHAQIAQTLGISEGTSKSNYAKAKARIKELYYKHISRYENKSV